MAVVYVLVGLYCWAIGTLLVRWGLRSWRRQESFADRLRGLPLTDKAKLGLERTFAPLGMFHYVLGTLIGLVGIMTASGTMAALGRLTPTSPRTTQMRVDVIVLLILLAAVVVTGWTVISISCLNRPRWLIPPHLRGKAMGVRR